MIDQKEPTLNFNIQDVEKVDSELNKKNLYCKKIIKPTNEEINFHKDYLKTTLKKNFY